MIFILICLIILLAIFEEWIVPILKFFMILLLFIIALVLIKILWLLITTF